METTLAELSNLLKANKSVVFITGAGLSAASGELCRAPGRETYRGAPDSVLPLFREA